MGTIRQIGSAFAACSVDGYPPWPTEQTPVPVIACLIGRNAERLRDGVPSWLLEVVVDRD